MKYFFCVLCAMTLLALGSLSLAHDVSGDPACKDEVAKLCPGKARGRAMGMCIHENEAKLSPACKEKLQAKHAEMMEKMHEGREACAADIEKFCADKKGKGPREVISCLKTHEAELSPSCKDHAQHGPGHGAMIPSSHKGVVTEPQPAPPVGTGTVTPAPATK